MKIAGASLVGDNRILVIFFVHVILDHHFNLSRLLRLKFVRTFST